VSKLAKNKIGLSKR